MSRASALSCPRAPGEGSERNFLELLHEEICLLVAKHLIPICVNHPVNREGNVFRASFESAFVKAPAIDILKQLGKRLRVVAAFHEEGSEHGLAHIQGQASSDVTIPAHTEGDAM